jgi:hypothetical protein
MMRKVVLVGVTFVGILICGLATASVAFSQPFLLNGTHWSQISYDAKIMYVKGVGNMADFEVQAGALAKGRNFCLASTLVKELQDKTIDVAVKEVDQYYKDNPNMLNTSVLEVLLRRANQVCPPETPKK